MMNERGERAEKKMRKSKNRRDKYAGTLSLSVIRLVDAKLSRDR